MTALKSIRKDNGMSQQVLADRLGVSRSTVAMWEIGGSEPDNQALLNMAELFSVTVDFLLGRQTVLMEDDPPAPDRLSEKELRLVEAYHAKPEFQGAVDALLGIGGEGG